MELLSETEHPHTIYCLRIYVHEEGEQFHIFATEKARQAYIHEYVRQLQPGVLDYWSGCRHDDPERPSIRFEALLDQDAIEDAVAFVEQLARDYGGDTFDPYNETLTFSEIP